MKPSSTPRKRVVGAAVVISELQIVQAEAAVTERDEIEEALRIVVAWGIRALRESESAQSSPKNLDPIRGDLRP